MASEPVESRANDPTSGVTPLPMSDQDSMPQSSKSSLNGYSKSAGQPEAFIADEEALGAALYVATSILQQGLDFLQTSLTSEEQLFYQSKLLPGSTIGKHFRHARDHFNLLAQCLAQQRPPYVLSYDTRTRDTPMERSLPAAISSMQASVDELNSLLAVESQDGSLQHGGHEHPLRNDTPITLHAVTPFPQVLQTSLGRELWFVALHAIHHYAIIRVLAGELELIVDETFGVAPSTLRYRQQDLRDSEKAKI